MAAKELNAVISRVKNGETEIYYPVTRWGNVQGGYDAVCAVTGDLKALETDEKSNLVGAVNEVRQAAGSVVRTAFTIGFYDTPGRCDEKLTQDAGAQDLFDAMKRIVESADFPAGGELHIRAGTLAPNPDETDYSYLQLSKPCILTGEGAIQNLETYDLCLMVADGSVVRGLALAGELDVGNRCVAEGCTVGMLGIYGDANRIAGNCIAGGIWLWFESGNTEPKNNYCFGNRKADGGPAWYGDVYGCLADALKVNFTDTLQAPDGGFYAGAGAFAETGGAAGYGALAGAGFSGGAGAKAAVPDGQASPIDAIQLGAGTNAHEKTLQVYAHTLLDAEGHVPEERMPALAAHFADSVRHIAQDERDAWNNTLLTKSAEGVRIELHDAAPQGTMRELEIFGKSEQKTSVQGKNLLDCAGIDAQTKGVTFACQPDGSVLVSGTSSETFVISRQIDMTPVLKTGKSYVKSMAGGVAGLAFVLAVTRTDGTVQYPGSFTYDSTVSTAKVWLQINDSGVTVDAVVRLQIEEGGTPTTYEPFVPDMPSPKYPSDILSAADFQVLCTAGTEAEAAGTEVFIPYVLRGVPDRESGWAARDCITVKGGAVTLVRKVGEIALDGTEPWAIFESGNIHQFHIIQNASSPLYNQTIGGSSALCSSFQNAAVDDRVSKDNIFYILLHSVGFTCRSIPDLEGWKAFLAERAEAGAPVTVQYALAEPETEDLTETPTGQALLRLCLTAPDAAVSNTAETGLRVCYERDLNIVVENLEKAVAALAGGGS